MLTQSLRFTIRIALHMADTSYEKQFYFFIVFVIVMIFMLVHLNKEERSRNKMNCESLGIPLHGLITKKEGHGIYGSVKISNMGKWINLVPSSVKYQKGFGQYHIFEVGDSIFKLPNSKEVTIRHGDSVSVFIMDCNEKLLNN